MTRLEPAHGSPHGDRFRSANRFFVAMIALTWVLLIVTIVVTKTR